VKRIPKNITGKKLIKLLSVLGYEETRQVDSHVRLTTFLGGTHNITIPLHDPIRIGTLSAILNDIAYHHKKSKQQIIEILF
jgi:predicted RNA binding protein YcfA (HicA-like mRNA interferase family)